MTTEYLMSHKHAKGADIGAMQAMLDGVSRTLRDRNSTTSEGGKKVTLDARTLAGMQRGR